MRFAVPEDSDPSSWASTDSSTLTVKPIKFTNSHGKKAITVQKLGIDRFRAENPVTVTMQQPPLPASQSELAPRGRGSAISEHDNNDSELPGACRSGNDPNTIKPSKRQALRRRVSKLFTGPHNASLEPHKAPSQILAPYSFSNVVYRGTLAATHVMVPVYRPPATVVVMPKSSLCAAKEPEPFCLKYIDTIYEDGSSIADCSTSGKYDGQRDSKCSMIEPTVPSRPDMQFLPLATQDPFMLSPSSHHRARTLDSFKTASAVSNHGVFDSRNGGPPIRGLYRNFQGHHEQLTELQMTRKALGHKHIDQTMDIGSDWAAGDVTWAHNANELARVSLGDRAAAVKLTELSAGNRRGFVVEKAQEDLPTSQLAAMDIDNASRDWNIQPRNHKEKHFHISTSPIITSDRDADLPRAPTRRASPDLGPFPTVNYMPSAPSQPSLLMSDALDAALMEQAASTGATHTPTGSEIIKNRPLTAPIASRSCVSKCPDQARSGKMISTTRLPSRLPSVVNGYSGPEIGAPREAGADTDAANDAFFSSQPAGVTEQVASLVRNLENERDRISAERDRLLAKNEALLSALTKAQELMDGGTTAYDALNDSIDQQIQELRQRNCEFHAQLEGQEGEVVFLKEMLVERDKHEGDGGSGTESRAPLPRPGS